MSGEMDLALLAPAAVLALWTCIMLVWMVTTRLPALRAAGIDLGKMTGGKGTDADGVLPAKTQWVAHNYNHLLEQPTAFYAVVLILFVGGGTTPLTVGLAWAYALIRIAHSLWQALVNRVNIRFLLFAASTACLTILAVLAVILTLA
jgi:hypothetical protein